MPAKGGATPAKSADAFRTIGELSVELGVPQHILRYWETRFPQLRPLQRAGNRRYYRPEDVALVRRIATALNHDGYTIRGVQQLLAGQLPGPGAVRDVVPPETGDTALVDDLRRIRALLADALAD